MTDQIGSIRFKRIQRLSWIERFRDQRRAPSELTLSLDLGSTSGLFAAAVATTILICLVLALRFNHLDKTLGDTDDAMRLVLVRDLLSGRGWYDQWVGRLQPPIGVYLHWSRLIDGGLAGLIWLLERFLSPVAAESAARLIWPLMWVFPAIASALTIARNLGGCSAVYICTLLCLANLALYLQFLPGRVDHHDVQIVMTLIALACATASTRRIEAALAAGVATGFGLAIGIEALPFHALIGLSYGLRLAMDREDRQPARAYGLSLVLATLFFFGVQTPPWRWMSPFCDAIGLNLAIAVAIAGLGLATVATCADRLSSRARIGLLVALGVAVGAVYLALDPSCLQGPFGDVDPKLRPIWFDHIAELASWPKLWIQDRDAALQSIAVALMGSVAAIILIIHQWPRPKPATLLAIALLALAGVGAALAMRMESYALWFAAPLLAAALSQCVSAIDHRLTPTMAISSTAILALLISPSLIGQGLIELTNPFLGRAGSTVAPVDHCSDTAAYRPLAALPAGVVLAHIDLGPFVVAHTHDSALAAPYLVTWGILSAHRALTSPSIAAEGQVRALNIAYVLDCPAKPAWGGANSLEGDLRQGRIPSWLQHLSRPGETLQIYRVRPAEAGL